MPLILCKAHLVTLHLQTLKNTLVALTLNLTCHKGILVQVSTGRNMNRVLSFCGLVPVCVVLYFVFWMTCTVGYE